MLSLEEVQKTELAIMAKLHDYCEAHGLTYVLYYGTLLGAVRHKGFIPWDNDMDIAMPRADFERFLELTKTEPVADHLYVTHYTIDPKYHYMCIRVCDDRTSVNVPYIEEQPERLGVWVDIFPLDTPVQNPVGRFVQKYLLKLHWLVFRANIYGENHYRNELIHLAKFLAVRLMPNKNNRNNRAIARIEQWGNKNAAKHPDAHLIVVFEESGGGGGDVNPGAQNRLLVPFEQYQFYIAQTYDAGLTHSYGNYMQLPPEEKRMTHAILAEWK